MNSGTRRRGFSLLEAIVSTVLITVGLVSVIGAYTNIARTQRVTMQQEQMQRLALDKYDELVATEALQTQSLNGDFSDRGYDNFVWSASVQTTGINNLSDLTVTVTPRDTTDTSTASISGAVYQPPQTSTGTAGGTTP